MADAEQPRPTPLPRTSDGRGGFDRRTLVLSATLLFGAIVGGILVVSVTSDAGDRPDQQLAEGEIPPAAAIPQPGRGRPPANPGERGGWEQTALFGLLVTAMSGIGVVIFRGGRRARENRARWAAAGASGRDGALDSDDEPATATGPGADATPPHGP